MYQKNVLIFAIITLLFVEVNAQDKIGIGTALPQQMLSIAEGLNIDQNNANRSALLNGIRFGSNSNVGIASNRSSNNLQFYTNNVARMTITNDGVLLIGSNNEYAKVNIRKESRYDYTDFQSASALIISGEATSSNEYVIFGSDNTHKLSFINAEKIANYGNAGSTLLLQRRGYLVVGNITQPTEKMEVAGNLRITGMMMVDSNKGIIRNSTTEQLVKQVGTVTVSGSFAPGETRQFNIQWPSNFASTPDAYIGNVISGAGGWAECVMTLALVSSSGGKLYVFNPRNTTFNPSFTINILGFGTMPL